MLLFDVFSNIISFLAFAAALVVGISIHEYAHALAADRLGDNTPRSHGRLTINPVAHLDPLGTVMLLVAGFGWGKPVPINPHAFQRPAVDELLVALAGPASNGILAAALGLLFQFIGDQSLFGQFLMLLIQINVLLMLFNLIPIPPLDGSKILRVILGEDAFRSLEAISLPLIIGLLLLLRTTELGNLLSDGVATLTRFFLGA